MATDNTYTAENIQVLEGLEPVRKRPGMYIGSTDERGLHQLFREILDNSLDEYLAGYATEVWITLNKDGSMTVQDNGRGIPTDLNAKYKLSGLELAMTRLHAGGKFDAEAYKASGGLHGVGAAAVNALSKWMTVEVAQKGKLFYQSYKEGKPDAPLKEIGKSAKTGTKTTFLPDTVMFSTITWNYNLIRNETRDRAYLFPKLLVHIRDERAEDIIEDNFYFEGGIKSLVAHFNHTKQVVSDIFYVAKEIKTAIAIIGVEVAMQYNEDYGETVESYVNVINTKDGGTHLSGFRTALTRSLNDYGKKIGAIKEGQESFIGDDLKEGLTAVVYIKMPADRLQFESQTKTKLNNAEIQPAVYSVVKDALDAFFEESPRDGRAILEKVFLAAKARLAAKAAKEAVIRKGAFEGSALPGKLADCQSRDPAQSELFIVEGDSAGGCFAGNTKVALADGRNITFSELHQEFQNGKENFCYTINKDGKVALEKIESVRITNKSAKVIKIILDNGEEIICTPDHKFMLRNGKYQQAQNLTPTDSLMPLNRQHSRLGKRITIEGYELVFDPTENRWLFTHVLADDYNINHKLYSGSDSYRHHKDFNKLNNNPSNIARLSKEAHLEIHRLNARKTLGRPDVLEKVRLLHQTQDFKEKIKKTMSAPKMRQMLSTRAKKQWENIEYKEFMSAKFLDFYQKNEDYREKNNNQLNKSQKEYWADSLNRQLQSEKVSQFFKTHPEQKEVLSEFAKSQWQDKNLLAWRKNQTALQWTPEFREKRKASLNKLYRDKALKLMHDFYMAQNEFKNSYEKKRVETKDKSFLRFDNILRRYFDNDSEKLQNAVVNFNHKIKKVESLNEKMDVYDLEVPSTHNFALSTGVFVHNSAKQGRDRKFQAILPLFGKVLNTERARIDQIVESDKFKSLIIAIGAGIADQFNIDKLRYHRIIIMADADVDGSHIKCLYLTFLYRHLKMLVERGHIYVALPPLYKLEWGKDNKKYAYTESEKDNIAKELGSAVKLNVQRYKGLGEMNAGELWETTLNPANRILKQITVEDLVKADEVFQMLMSDDVPPRKRFIQTHAKTANLDI